MSVWYAAVAGDIAVAGAVSVALSTVCAHPARAAVEVRVAAVAAVCRPIAWVGTGAACAGVRSKRQQRRYGDGDHHVAPRGAFASVVPRRTYVCPKADRVEKKKSPKNSVLLI